jgi:heme A synthase
MEQTGQANEAEKPVQKIASSNPMVKAIILPDVLLVIQFLLGMFNNFYVKFPDQAGPLDNWKYVLHSWSEIAHIILGIVLLVIVIMNMVRAARMKSRHMKTVGYIGLAAVLLAIIGGVLFVTTQVDLYSYLMSIGFVAAIMNVNIGLLTFSMPKPS